MTDTVEAFKAWHATPGLHDCWSAWQEATRQAEERALKTILAYAPQFPNCETPEPSLRTLIYLYYQEYFDDPEYQSLAERYIAGLTGFLDRAALSGDQP